MASGTMDGLGLTSPGTEQDRLNKLLSLFDEKINLGDGPVSNTFFLEFLNLYWDRYRSVDRAT